MNGFIELTNEYNESCLVNIRHIELVFGSTVFFDLVLDDSGHQSFIECRESYEEIKAKIAEALKGGASDE